MDRNWLSKQTAKQSWSNNVVSEHLVVVVVHWQGARVCAVFSEVRVERTRRCMTRQTGTLPSSCHVTLHLTTFFTCFHLLFQLKELVQWANFSTEVLTQHTFLWSPSPSLQQRTINSVQFSSRWYLCTQKSPYALHPFSRKLPQHHLWNSSNVHLTDDGPLSSLVLLNH